MNLSYIDLIANKGDSMLHQSSAASKFLLTLSLIVSIILADQPIQLIMLVMVLLIGYRLANISLIKFGHYAIYPASFSLPFVIFKLSSVTTCSVVILKAVTAALSLLLLIFTTPYPQIFGLLYRFLPGVLVEGMFFTYRIFFILISQIQNLLTIQKLRGGRSPIRVLGNLKNLAGVLGVLFIHAFDLSERMYQIMIIRGYTGHLGSSQEVYFHWRDLLLIITGIIVIVLVVIL
ncbi:MAG: hypothetical protein KAX49_01165 [Halanaerobiales bacterium]|nr:hypothetical protein [Halanaerobiales bacterium]